MTPVQSYERKRQQVKQSMEELGFTDWQVEQILAGLRPGNIDDVMDTLDLYQNEDQEGETHG